MNAPNVDPNAAPDQNAAGDQNQQADPTLDALNQAKAAIDAAIAAHTGEEQTEPAQGEGEAGTSAMEALMGPQKTNMENYRKA
jgi:hypothetical protein